jgi:hypothetical protein
MFLSDPLEAIIKAPLCLFSPCHERPQTPKVVMIQLVKHQFYLQEGSVFDSF